MNTNSRSKKTDKWASRLKSIALFLLFAFATILVWILSGTNILSSPSQTLANLDKSLAMVSNEVVSKWNSLWNNQQNNNPAKIAEKEAFYTHTTLSGQNVTAVGLQEIMQAIDSLLKQANVEQKNQYYHNRLGILYAQVGDFANGIAHFNQAIGLCRQQLEAMSNLSAQDKSAIHVQLGCAHSNLARIYNKLGDHKKVIAELEELNKEVVFAGDIPTSIKLAKKTSQKIQIPHSHKKMNATEAAILARAEALRQVGRLPEAVQEYTKLIRLNPHLAVAHQRLGLAAASDNNLWLAINELQTAAQLDKEDPDTQNDLGLVYLQIGDIKSGKQAFSNAHNIDPKHLSASLNLATTMANSGDYQSGIGIMRQATRYHPNSPVAHNNLAALIARTNNQTEAAKEFAKAIHLDPTLPSAHYGLGLALLKLKSYPAAAKEFQTALTLNPGILDLQNKIDLANRCDLRSLAYTQQNFN